MKTACVISSARCASRTCRSATEYTRLTWAKRAQRTPARNGSGRSRAAGPGRRSWFRAEPRNPRNTQKCSGNRPSSLRCPHLAFVCFVVSTVSSVYLRRRRKVTDYFWQHPNFKQTAGSERELSQLAAFPTDPAAADCRQSALQAKSGLDRKSLAGYFFDGTDTARGDARPTGRWFPLYRL
jgi:hypothetical protein